MAADPHSEPISFSDEAKALLPDRADLRKEAKYVIGSHRITVGRRTRGSNKGQHFVSGSALCSCGWSSATHITAGALIESIWGHVK